MKTVQLSDQAIRNVATALFRAASGNPNLSLEQACLRITRNVPNVINPEEAIMYIFSRHIRAFYMDGQGTDTDPYYTDCIANWVQTCFGAEKLSRSQIASIFREYAPD